MSLHSTRFFFSSTLQHVSSSSFFCWKKIRISFATSSNPTGWLSWYASKLDTHPLLTKGISSGLIACAGDISCQTLVERGPAYDYMRSVRFTILGAFLVAPAVHVWYSILNKAVPGLTAVAVAKRVALDQFVFSPSFLPVWLTCLWGLEGERDLSLIYGRIVESMPTIMIANWCLWLPAQLINFRFVPLKFQVLYSNIVALLWNVYLSYSQTQKQLDAE